MISGGAASKAPPPEEGSPPKAPAIVVTIASKGEIFVGARPVADADLERALREIAARDKDTQLVLRADQHVASARVVFVLDRAKQAGLTRIGISRMPDPSRPGPPPPSPAPPARP